MLGVSWEGRDNSGKVGKRGGFGRLDGRVLIGDP